MTLKAWIAVIAITLYGLPITSATDVGMSETQLQKIEYVAKKGISLGAYPGAAIAVGKNGSLVLEKGIGNQSWNGTKVLPTRTLYDLASLTKVISTTSAIMKLYDDKKIELDAPVFRYLPSFTGKDKDKVTVKQLLTHTSGLPAGKKILLTEDPVEVILNTKLVCAPGQCYNYSDLGPVLLGLIVEEISGQSLDEFVNENIFEPLHLKNTMYLPPDSLDYRIASTDFPKGVVSDITARRFGGVSGNAGLFSTVDDLAIFSQMVLNGGEINGIRIFKDSTVRLFTRNQIKDRALGWQTCKGSFGCGDLSPNSYGHTGYTGTSIWIDPDKNVFVVVLTNRLDSPKTRRAQKITISLRQDISNIVLSAINGIGYEIKNLSINKNTTYIKKKVKKRHKK